MDDKPVTVEAQAAADLLEAFCVTAYIHGAFHVGVLTDRRAYLKNGIELVETAGQDATHLHLKLAHVNALLTIALDGTAGKVDEHPA